MGLLDEALKQFTQGSQGGTGQGSTAGNSPLIAIFQELLVGKPQAGNQPTPQQQASVPQAASSQAGGQDAGSLGGLGGLLAQLQAAGLDNVVKSWIGTGQNQPVQPDELGDALGKKAVTQMADKAGCSKDDLLAQLSAALPGLIDKLTHDGRIPTQQEIKQRLSSGR